jgi:glyoxylase-like metal-dependent hydrolase (beta-lactamase superfamily II)
MKSTVVVAIVAATTFSLSLGARDTSDALEAALRASGAAGLHSIQYSGTGATFGFGQAVAPGGPWPRFTMTRYVAAINYERQVAREEIVRVDDANPPRGGGAGPYNPATHQGGIRPIPFGPQTQTRQATGSTDAGVLQLWMMTPHGFLQSAVANTAAVRTQNVRGRRVHAVTFTVGRHTVRGTINDQHLVERVETRIYNNVVGDMAVETIFSGYRDFAGVMFPTRIVQRQGGHPTLELTVDAVEPNHASAAALEAPPGTPQPGAPPLRLVAQPVAEGIWYLEGASPSSYLVEFDDHLVAIEAPGNDARVEATLAEAARVAPAKPIRYVISTHHHFDHAGGVRGFVAEAITIVTHASNKKYYERIVSNPHTLSPDRLARANRRARIEGVADRRVLTDGMRVLELYHVRGNFHDPAMLMVYVPSEKLLIQADAYNPRPPDARPLPAPSPFTINLLDNVRRLKLDVERIAHIHGGIEPFEALVRAAGGSGARSPRGDAR